MVFRTFFNEPRPKGFLEIGEILALLDIDTDDDDRLVVTVSCDLKDEPKFNEVSHGFSAEVRYYATDNEPVSFTTLGYRTLEELHRDMRACNFDPRDFEYTFDDDVKDMSFTDQPDASVVNTIESKAEDFASIREDQTTKTEPSKQETPDMTFKQEIFTLIGTLTASVHRAQTELIETNRIALALSDKIGQEAFKDNGERTEILMTIDARPLTEAMDEFVSRISVGIDADAQTAVEGTTITEVIDTPEEIEDVQIAQSSDDFDSAVEDALAAGVEQALAVEIPADAPQPLPKASSVPNIAPAPDIAAETLDQSDDAKDFRTVVQFFLNHHTGQRDQLDIANAIFNTTWDHGSKRIKQELSRHLVKVPNSKMIWTARLNSLFKKFEGTNADAVLYGTTSPVSMKLTKDADGSYSFIKV